jgi:hypothetical protein
MAEKIKLVRRDTRPLVQVTVTDDNTGNPIDLTGAIVRMYFRALGGDSVLDTLVGVVLDGPAGQTVFAWNANTLDVEAGDYEGEIEVEFPTGARQTVFDVQKFKVREDFA